MAALDFANVGSVFPIIEAAPEIVARAAKIKPPANDLCDCVSPTSQNHANIQHDLEELAAQYAKEGRKDQDIELLAQMLVRAYDPCISCSVH